MEKIGWHRHEGSKEAIKKELKGVLAHGTWDYSEVIARDDLMKRKEPFNIGRLTTILSAKRWESPSVRKLKARIVFRGDDIQDGEGNLAVLLESKVNPAGISAIKCKFGRWIVAESKDYTTRRCPSPPPINPVYQSSHVP